jgi:putative transposase
MVSRQGEKLPVIRQCELLGVARAGVYRKPRPVSPVDLETMRRIDELYTKRPYYGSRRIAETLTRQGHKIGRDRVRRLMRLMGLEAIFRKPNLSQRHPQHKIYPYLLRHLAITRVNQVWSCDITYVPMALGYLYLVAIMDWYSRKVLSWRLSITLDSRFCVEALEEAFERYGRPEIFNTDQGVQFTCAAFIEQLESRGIRISMDGKGRCLDNIFVERLWRSLKYEEIYLKAYTSIAEARNGICEWFAFYNDERVHQALDYQTPAEVFAAGFRLVDNAARYPQEQNTSTTKEDSPDEKKLISSLIASHDGRPELIQPGGQVPL